MATGGGAPPPALPSIKAYKDRCGRCGWMRLDAHDGSSSSVISMRTLPDVWHDLVMISFPCSRLPPAPPHTPLPPHTPPPPAPPHSIPVTEVMAPLVTSGNGAAAAMAVSADASDGVLQGVHQVSALPQAERSSAPAASSAIARRTVGVDIPPPSPPRCELCSDLGVDILHPYLPKLDIVLHCLCLLRCLWAHTNWKNTNDLAHSL